jgi:hypothetical protein
MKQSDPILLPTISLLDKETTTSFVKNLRASVKFSIKTQSQTLYVENSVDAI